jgi:hypothetical protein
VTPEAAGSTPSIYPSFRRTNSKITAFLYSAA